MTAPDDPVEQVKRILADYHAATETLEHAQRFAEALAGDNDPGRRGVAAELIEIVGVPQ